MGGNSLCLELWLPSVYPESLGTFFLALDRESAVVLFFPTFAGRGLLTLSLSRSLSTEDAKVRVGTAWGIVSPSLSLSLSLSLLFSTALFCLHHRYSFE
jgi:hypothetical protein